MLVDPLAVGSFESAQLRVERADEHRSTLEAEIQAFVQGKRRPIPMKVDSRLPRDARQRLEQMAGRFAEHHGSSPAWGVGPEVIPGLQVGGEAPLRFMLTDTDFLVRWGVILGDLLHCLRSALDNLVWSATIIHQTVEGNPLPPTRPFPPRKKGDPSWGDVCFPTCRSLAAWREAVKRNLWGVGPVYKALIEDHQPYKRGDPTPQDSPLYILHELSNIDKHHGVNFLATRAQVQAVQMPPGTIFIPNTSWELKSHAEVGRIRFLTQEAVDRYPEQMNMNLGITFEIGFGKGTPAQDRGIREVIEAISSEVRFLVLRANTLILRATGQVRD